MERRQTMPTNMCRIERAQKFRPQRPISSYNLPPSAPPNFTPPFSPSTERNYKAAQPSRRPLRSSPLAGPSVSSSSGIIVAINNLDSRAHDSAVSSTPDLVSSISPPSRSPSSLSLPGTPSHSLDQSPEHSSFFFLSPKAHRPPAIDTQVSNEQSKSNMKAPQTPPPEPSASPTGRHQSKDSLSRVGSHIIPPPNFPKALSRNSTENWMTVNTYADIPRFSRLALSSDVVLPVAARSSSGRRLSQGSLARRTPVVQTTEASDVHSSPRSVNSHGLRSESPSTRRRPLSFMSSLAPSVPSLSMTLTRSSSNVSSIKEDLSEFGVVIPSSPPTSRSGSICSGIEETNEEFGDPVVPAESTNSNSVYQKKHRRRRSITNIGSWGNKIPSLRSNSIKHFKGLSFLSFSSDDTHESQEISIDESAIPSDGTDTDGEVDLPPLSFVTKFKTRNQTLRSDKAQALLGVDINVMPSSRSSEGHSIYSDTLQSSASDHLHSGKTGNGPKTGSVKKFWKSIAGSRHRQTTRSSFIN